MKLPSFKILLLFVCLTLVGLAMLPLLSVKLAPSQILPQINVSFSMPGNSSRIVEMEATSKLEAMLSRIKGVQNIYSTSGTGRGNISLELDKHTNMDAARFEVSTIIRQTWPHLPGSMYYPTISVNRSDEQAGRPFLSYTLNAPANPIVIQRYAENKIKPKLAQISGVSFVSVSGAMPMEWRLEYDYLQLRKLGIDQNDIIQVIQNALNREFLGTANIEEENQSNSWIRVALAPSVDSNYNFDPRDIQVKNVDGKIITLDQLVKVTQQEKQAQSYFRINGLNSVYLSVIADEQANQLDLVRLIKKKIEELKSTFPPGYEIHASYDATEYIQKELEKVYFRAGLTLLILFVFVLIIYRDARYLLLIFLSLFMNIAISIMFYYFARLEIQLYSLAGITISLTLVIDNTIIMSDQIIIRRNKKAFLAILTATLTTITSLVIIFFMDEKIRLNLQDFAKVIIINLAISLFVALFLVPALIDKLGMGKGRHRTQFLVSGTRKMKKIGVQFKLFFNRFYAGFCRFIWKWRIPACILILLVFGLPVFLLPDKLEGEGKWKELYNKTLGSNFYKEKIKPHTDVYLGGTLRLFVQKVFEGSYFTDREETSLYVTATLPNGATIEQMNNLIQQMESYISQFKEVRQFRTEISGARRAQISISFTKEGERSGFPYLLKSQLIRQSTELGGGSWGVYGFGDGFSNDVRESAGSYQVILKGYNYDELWEWTEKFKEILLEYRRIKEVTIGSEFSWYKDDYQEFMFNLNREQLAKEGMNPIELFSSLNLIFGQGISAGYLQGEYGLEDIVLHSKQSKEYDIWSMEFIPGTTGSGREYKLSKLASLEKSTAPQSIVKENQQYRLCLQYEYIGAYQQGEKVLNQQMEEFRKVLPLGYSIESQERKWSWQSDNNKQYWLLLLIFVIIFFTCSVLFNSLSQPLSVIFVIPISFIGIFLTFYLFKLNFDQGGFASFILLCGLSVNANIYIINEYNNIRQNKLISPQKAYIKAWNAKIVPIFLTVISSILGFIPFMIGEREAFWFPLAAGTIGGLIVSILGIFCFLPLFMGIGKTKVF